MTSIAVNLQLQCRLFDPLEICRSVGVRGIFYEEYNCNNGAKCVDGSRHRLVVCFDIKVTSYNWSLLIGSLISVAFMVFALTIVATVLANQEHIIDRLIGMDPQNKERIETQVKSHIPSYSTKDRQNMDRPKVH